jgi:hypothetical protein
VCAPTGAGKTNIAMITVLREVAANMAHGVIQRDAFKVRQGRGPAASPPHHCMPQQRCSLSHLAS